MKKTERVNLQITTENRKLLEKLAKIHDRSMTNMVEVLVIREAKEYGLIEARDK